MKVTVKFYLFFHNNMVQQFNYYLSCAELLEGETVVNTKIN